MHRFVVLVVLVGTILAACSSEPTGPLPPAPVPITTEELTGEIAASGSPAVVNVWASWCVPCRSEAPLLDRAAAESPAVRFIGLNVRDDQSGARSFIAEFFPTAAIEHLSDSAGNVPVDLGGSRGVPLTFFYAPGGELVTLHTGVIDERTLALQIDEILSR